MIKNKWEIYPRNTIGHPIAMNPHNDNISHFVI